MTGVNKETEDTSSTGLLSGLRVLEVGQYVAGPFCTYLMAAFGAEVIKIESPGQGDLTRRIGPFPQNIPHLEKSALFLYLNAGKKSVTLDVNTQTGARLLRELLARVDIVVENLPAKTMSASGLDYQAVATINPRLVLTSISTFGRSGPYSGFKGQELVGLAVGGWMYALGEPDEPPVKFGGSPASCMAGYAGFAGSLVAYHYANLTGEGQHVDVSLMECLASGHAQALVEYVYTGKAITRGRSFIVYPCKDGFIRAVHQQHQWPSFAKLIGHPELTDDPRFSTVEARQRNAEEFALYVLPWTMEQTKEEIYRQAQELRLPFGYFADIEEVRQSPQFLHREFFVEVEHPVAGLQVHPGLPVHVGGGTWQLGAAPTLGQHNEEIICGQLGYSRSELVQMRRAAII